MRVAHFSLWAPRRSGLHEFVIDQITCERRAGIESIFINCDEENPDPKRFTDGDIVAEQWNSAYNCDVWVMHRSIPLKMISDLRKFGNVAIMHGTAEYMVMLETQTNEKKFDVHLDMLARFDKVVAINHSDYNIMKLYNKGNNLVFIQDSIDMKRFDINGFQWEYSYRPAIISTANIRFNKTPMSLLWSMPEIMKLIPTARLNLFCIRLNDVSLWKETILKSNSLSIACENVHLQFRDLRPFVRGADISFNSNINGITSRDTLEAMAMGVPVVSYRGEYTKYHAIVMDPTSIASAMKRCWDDISKDHNKVHNETYEYAKEHFCMDKATVEYSKLYEEVVKINHKRNGKSKEKVTNDGQKVEEVSDNEYADILIPVYNNFNYTHECILSIVKNTRYPFKITVINNGSTDNTYEYLNSLKNNSWFSFINNKDNLGWVKAINQGIDATNGKYVVFMNNDIVVGEGWLKKILSPLQHKNIGACGPINSNDHDWQYFGRVRKNLLHDLPVFKHPEDIPACNEILEDKYGSKFLKIRGMLAFFLVAFRRETIEKVGLLDEDFGIGLGDDDDYARRLETNGFELALALNCYVIHHSQSTFNKMFNEEQMKANRESALKLLKKKYPDRY